MIFIIIAQPLKLLIVIAVAYLTIPFLNAEYFYYEMEALTRGDTFFLC